ncbi:cell division protein FtsX [Fundidesulfovibrio soli]|uniref:cell division protein FtsX n=1 Tax=Fundidesulfovibrio soli TaxID=2922716 RepID=UPI001FAF6ECF
MILLRRALARAFLQIGGAPGLHLMAALALALACFLAGGLGLFLANLEGNLLEKHGHAQFRIYWKPGTGLAEVRRQWELIRAMPGVDELTGLTPEESLESLRSTLDEGYDFPRAGGSAPLPPKALASFAVRAADTAPALELLERLKALPGVERVRIAPAQLDVAQALRSLSAAALWPLAGALALAVALVAYLSARLCLEGRRAEVELMRLVGAKEWFVRLPWVVSAALTGLAGSLLGLAALAALRLVLAGRLHGPPLWIRLAPMPLEEMAAMVALAACMAALGGLLAARR